MEERDDLLDIKQAARLLHVSEVSLRRWTASGRLPCLRVGGRRERRFRRADLLAFLEEERASAALPAGHQSADAGYAVIQGRAIPNGTHLCGVYGSDAGRATLTVGFIADGLGLGSRCFLVGERWEETLARLEREGKGVRGDVEEGRIVLTPHASSAEAQYEHLQGQLAGALRAGARSLRVVGDMWTMAERVGLDTLLRYEAGFEPFLAARFPMVALCLYDARRFSAIDLLHALQSHPDTLSYPSDRLLA